MQVQMNNFCIFKEKVTYLNKYTRSLARVVAV
jgi:hypothetical protein